MNLLTHIQRNNSEKWIVCVAILYNHDKLKKIVKLFVCVKVFNYWMVVRVKYTIYTNVFSCNNENEKPVNYLLLLWSVLMKKMLCAK
jgi:hypothetical protein